MKLLLLSDTHGQNDVLKTLPATDVLIHCGDSTQYGSTDNLREFAEIFGDCNATFKLVIAGNHDACFQKHPFESKDILLANGILYLEDEGVKINGIKFWGIPWTPPFLDWYFMANEEKRIEKWGQVPDDVDVLMSHGPPYGVLDQLIKGGKRVGSVEHRNKVFSIQPTLNVFGHIHEQYGWKRYVDIDFINCSLLNFHYEMVNQPVVYELKEKNNV
ncbi:metallophosphatase domain-containing protein [bacterium]|nr:metallophosphatase domain-containing protein [bacterium]